MRRARGGCAGPLIAVLVGFVIVPAGLLWLQAGSAPFIRKYFDWFGLQGTTTVAEYRATPDVETRVAWSTTMCLDGECLPDKDWKCGFVLDDKEIDDVYAIVETCFDDTVKVADENVTLDQIRKYCGQKNARFVGEEHVEAAYGKGWLPERCAELGGSWGELSSVWKPNE